MEYDKMTYGELRTERQILRLRRDSYAKENKDRRIESKALNLSIAKITERIEIAEKAAKEKALRH